ncbi:MAG: sugar transferase [Bdellovibrionales bacterium]|nr:sugar transferase [Bdellovibrionales bacterium]
MTFVVLGYLVWMCYFIIALEQPFSQASILLLFSAVCSLLTYMFLRFLGYFQILRPKPRKSDLFLVLLAYPLFATICNGLTLMINGVPCVSSFGVVVLSPFFAVALFVLDYLMANFFLRAHIRRKVVIDLLPLESIAFIKRLGQMECASHLEFLNRSQLEEYVRLEREREIDLIIISRAAAQKFDADGVMIRAHLSGIAIQDHCQAVTELCGRVRLDESDLWSYILHARAQTLFLRAYSSLKALLEPIIAAVLLALLSPLLVIIAVLSKCICRGPVLYTQERVGYLGSVFTLVKFRTMNENAEDDGAQWSQRGDSRITSFGLFLRKTRLDELPQLWNVLRGEMSFVGPRPERPEICEMLQSSISLFPLRTIVRPGITGWAQIHSGYAASIEESRVKLEYDLFYLQHTSPRLDLIIIIKTLLTAVEGAVGDDVARMPLEAPLLVDRSKMAFGGGAL